MYEVKSIQTPFGEGKSIELDDRFYRQISLESGATLRLFTQDDAYRGVLHKGLKNNHKDYVYFKKITDTIKQKLGNPISNSESNFVKYINDSFRDVQLGTGATFSINRWNLNEWDVKHDYLVSKARPYGWKANILGAAASFLYFTLTKDLFIGVLSTGLLYPLLELIGGCFSSAPVSKAISPESQTWSGPIHSIGFYPSYFSNLIKLKNPNYAINKIEKLCKKVEKKPGLEDEIQKLVGVVAEEFQESGKRKGLTLTYRSMKLEDVVDFYSSMLLGAPMKKPMQKVPEKPAPKVAITDPWEVNINKVEDE